MFPRPPANAAHPAWFPLLLTVLVLVPAAGRACIWDRDTLEHEAKGLPDVVQVITGRFERNPPLFYEMRLRRVTAVLRARPDDLAAYDDAGAACDRLGKGDDALAWMAKKRARLERLTRQRGAAGAARTSGDLREHWYRAASPTPARSGRTAGCEPARIEAVFERCKRPATRSRRPSP